MAKVWNASNDVTDANETKLEELRFRLLRKFPFFGSLIHRVKYRVTKDESFVNTAATNGRELVFGENLLNKFTPDEKLFLFAHELEHCVFLHPQRMYKIAGKDQQQQLIANMAADFLNNALLKEMGFTIPKGALIHDDLTPDKYSLEELYAFLKKIMPPCNGGQGKKPNKNEPGNVQLPGKDSFDPDLMDPHGFDSDEEGDEEQDKEMSARDIAEAEAEMQAVIEQAAQHAKNAGRGTPMLDRMIEKWKSVKIPWEVLLHDWMEKKTKLETTWSRPHRRTWSLDLYLPTRGGNRMGHIGVAIDLSGSIGAREIGLFCSQMGYVFDVCKPSKVTVITFDDGIRDEFDFDDLPDPRTIKLQGGGGTDFRPVFRRFGEINQQSGGGDDKFEGLIFMTDLMGPFPDKAPDYPVVFLSTYKAAKQPFGDLIDASDVLNQTGDE